MCAFSISVRPPPVPGTRPITFARCGASSWTSAATPLSFSHCATKRASAASPAPPATRVGLTDSIATSRSRSLCTRRAYNRLVLAFLGVSVLLIVTPGPDMALTLRSALFKGKRGGLATAAGVATGQAVGGLAGGVGRAAVVAPSVPPFVAFRVAGALYPVDLGMEALRGAAHAVTPRPGSAYRQGLLCNLANQKMAVFCVSMLPQFASPS